MPDHRSDDDTRLLTVLAVVSLAVFSALGALLVAAWLR